MTEHLEEGWELDEALVALRREDWLRTLLVISVNRHSCTHINIDNIDHSPLILVIALDVLIIYIHDNTICVKHIVFPGGIDLCKW